MKRINVWNTYDLAMQKACDRFAGEYMHFLDHGKTERECVDQFVAAAEADGYEELSKIVREGRAVKPGDKVYAVWMNKSIVLFHIGNGRISEGMNILGAHIDSPRLDVKQNPLYENGGIAYLDTHYYGGIKKYQYVAQPLALHGVVVKKNGETVELSIGEDEDEPVFFVSDLLIHLAGEQMKKEASKVIEGENLDLVIGSSPVRIDASSTAGSQGKEPAKEDAVKQAVLSILNERFGITEEDFISAELEIVPAGKAGDTPRRTSCCLLVDKEEIGSVGATGMHSRFFENALAELLDRMGESGELILRRTLENSCMLSSDVSAAFDPIYAEAFEKKNAAILGEGIVFNKFTGSRGKSGSNDANAEYIAHLRGIFDEADIRTQTAELGKVDVGGGGTIAYILALYGMNVIDSGVAVLNMHAPYEATSKADVYEAYRAYRTFLEKAGFVNF